MKKIITILKLFLVDILGVNALFRFLNRDKAVILMYHGICENDFTLLKGYDERHIPKSLFRRQLSYLKRKGYNFVNMSELVDILKGEKKVERPVVLTFDDGFTNVMKNAYPIMKEFNARACLYLISGLIGKDELLWTDHIETVIRNIGRGNFGFVFKGEPIRYNLDTKKSSEAAMLDIKRRLKTISNTQRLEHLKQFTERKIKDIPEEFSISGVAQIKDLDKEAFEIGSHTRTHSYCNAYTSSKEYEDEIKGSKADLEKMFGCKIDHFSYPAGLYNNEAVEYVKQSGYKSAVTTWLGLNGKKTDLFKLKRIGAPESFLLFKAAVSGSYSFLTGLDRAY